MEIAPFLQITPRLNTVYQPTDTYPDVVLDWTVLFTHTQAKSNTIAIPLADEPSEKYKRTEICTIFICSHPHHMCPPHRNARTGRYQYYGDMYRIISVAQADRTYGLQYESSSKSDCITITRKCEARKIYFFGGGTKICKVKSPPLKNNFAKTMDFDANLVINSTPRRILIHIFHPQSKYHVIILM